MMKMQSRKTLRLKLLTGVILLLMAVPLGAQSSTPAPFKDFPSYVAWMQKNHKAPFNRSAVVIPQGAAKALQATQAKMQALSARTAQHAYQNIKVNQDRNPWPKTGVASAVNPVDPRAWVVMSNDFRVNVNRVFYHVSTNAGKTWTDDAMVGGADPFISFIPLTFQLDPGLSFDDAGNSYLSALSGNIIEDFTNNYLNLDTEVDEVQGFSNGTYSDIQSTVIDAQSCNGMFFGAFVCDAALSQPMNSTDSNPNSPNAGTTYVYYSYFCNLPSGSCTDGAATIPSFSSVILESHSSGPDAPFSAPALVSGSLTNSEFADMVIDPSGTPHIFFDEYSNTPTITMWESTLTGGVWTVSKILWPPSCITAWGMPIGRSQTVAQRFLVVESVVTRPTARSQHFKWRVEMPRVHRAFIWPALTLIPPPPESRASTTIHSTTASTISSPGRRQRRRAPCMLAGTTTATIPPTPTCSTSSENPSTEGAPSRFRGPSTTFHSTHATAFPDAATSATTRNSPPAPMGWSTPPGPTPATA